MKSTADVARWVEGRFANQKATWFGGGGTWPLVINLDPPTDKTVLADLAGVRAWRNGWRSFAGPGTVEWESRIWANAGNHEIPVRLVLANASVAACHAGAGDEWRRVTVRSDRLVHQWPGLLGHPVLRQNYRTWNQMEDADFERLLALLVWIQAHRGADCYLRELPIRGLDTKWLDSRRRLVLDLGIAIGLFDADCEDIEAGLGLRRKPARIRVRLLCPALRAACLGLVDIEAPAAGLGQLGINPSRLLVVENEQTCLAMPDMPDTVVVFGLGYSVTRLAGLGWLRTARHAAYWGDIDTHGLAILAMMRRLRRDIVSTMMDPGTWERYHDLGTEEDSAAGSIADELLDAPDREMLALLRDAAAKGGKTRLEQERLPWPECLPRLRSALGLEPVA